MKALQIVQTKDNGSHILIREGDIFTTWARTDADNPNMIHIHREGEFAGTKINESITVTRDELKALVSTIDGLGKE